MSQYQAPISPSLSDGSENPCAICLTSTRPGRGQAIFTAECSHSFHFGCITSNVNHGNLICPVCRAIWKTIPFQSPAIDPSLRTRYTRVLNIDRQTPRHFQHDEPSVFDDDDELVNQQPEASSSSGLADGRSIYALEVKAYPEVTAISKTATHSNFTILIHLKAPHTTIGHESQQSRAALDLVTVLDVSGSMEGSKLALLKQAMGFVIQNLGPSDRLSVVSFSDTACRLFPLRKMTDTGKQEALRAVNFLRAGGGTNIADGLKKGAKVITERKWKNPVCGVILLSDGQDNFTVNFSRHAQQIDYQSLLPSSMNREGNAGPRIPVHAFGFGTDHDAALMHSISESSGGTFSFIEAESVIQNAFAQCIGGLLSVVVQELKVDLECLHPTLQLSSIKAGSYKSSLISNGKKGVIEVGELYAEEERDFLVTLDVPVYESSEEMSLVKVSCVYRDAMSKELVTMNHATDVKIQRPETTEELVVSTEVDKHRNRFRAAEAMVEAKAAAERGDLAAAVSMLENCRIQILESVSIKAGDRLCIALDAELREMQERMANRPVYEAYGRAYVFAGISSHSRQRATAYGASFGGDLMGAAGPPTAYQTSSMAAMVDRSRSLLGEQSQPLGEQSQPHTR